MTKSNLNPGNGNKCWCKRRNRKILRGKGILQIDYQWWWRLVGWLGGGNGSNSDFTKENDWKMENLFQKEYYREIYVVENNIENSPNSIKVKFHVGKEKPNLFWYNQLIHHSLTWPFLWLQWTLACSCLHVYLARASVCPSLIYHSFSIHYCFFYFYIYVQWMAGGSMCVCLCVCVWSSLFCCLFVFHLRLLHHSVSM